MVSRDWRRWVSGSIAVALLGVFVWLVGPEQVATQLRRTDLPVFMLGIAATTVSLIAWSETQRTLLVASGAGLTPWRGFVVYNVGMFAKQVLPMGHAAGPILSAYAVGIELDRPYVTNLGPVSIAEFQLLVASICLSVGGLAYLVVTVPPTGIARTLQAAVAVVAAGLAALGLVVWYRRRTVERSLLGLGWCLRATVGRLSPRLRARLGPEVVRDGLGRYYATLEVVTADRRRSAVAFAWGLLGWVAFSLPLVTSAAALGVDVPVAVAFVVAPAAGIAGLVPLPGGIGSTELAVAGLLVTVGGLPVATAAGVTLLYRFCTYWFVVLVGGVASVYRSLRPSEMTRRAGRRP